MVYLSLTNDLRLQGDEVFILIFNLDFTINMYHRNFIVQIPRIANENITRQLQWYALPILNPLSPI